MSSALIILLASAPSQASGSEAQPFVLSTDVEAWPAKDIDSGWWPEEGPVRVRTEILAEGLAGIDIHGDSVVEQGEGGGVHKLDPDTAEGVVSVVLNMAASLHLSVDIPGYEWEGMLHEQAVDFELSESFSSFAFSEDGGASLSFPMNTEDVFAVEQGILPFVNVHATGALTPTANLIVSTDAIETSEGAFTATGQTVDTAGGSLDLDATGLLESELNLIVRGHAEVCIQFIDCYGDFSYDFNLDPVQHSQELAYETATVSHGGDAGGLARAGAGEGAEESGGCSTVPSSHPASVLAVMWLAAVVCLRRRA